jgi:hypothetical protein
VFKKSRIPFTVAGLLLMISIVSCITASDSVPTFNLKNKSLRFAQNTPSATITVVITEKNGKQETVKMSIKHKGTIKKTGFYTTSKASELKNHEELSLYGLNLRDIDFIDMYYQSLSARPKEGRDSVISMVRYSFSNLTDKTTIYVKAYGYLGRTEVDGKEIERSWLGLEPQEGSWGKTTDGYSLKNNVKKGDITRILDGQEGKNAEVVEKYEKTTTQGKDIVTSARNVPVPLLDLIEKN